MAHEKGFALWLIGIILASFALVSAIGSPIIGEKLEKIGRRCAYTLSGFLTGLGVLSWAILPYLDGDIFLVASFVGRMLQGLGTTFTLVAGFSIAASEYGGDDEAAMANMALVLSQMETAGSLGLICGPLLGAGLYYVSGFTITYIVYSGFFFLSIPVFFYILGPDRPYVNE